MADDACPELKSKVGAYGTLFAKHWGGEMKNTRARIFEAIGVGAVVVSLLFVAYEIRQANRIAIGTTSYEMSRNYMSLNELILANPEVAALLANRDSVDFEPSPTQKTQLQAFAHRLLNQWTATEEAYDRGLVSERSYQIALDDVASVAGNSKILLPAFKVSFERYDLSEYDVLEPLIVAIEAEGD